MKLNSIISKMGKPRLWLVFLILIPFVFNSIQRPTNDFETCAATVRDWVAGKTMLYDESQVFYAYLPWSLIIYLPFALLPQPSGLFLFNIISLGLLIWSTLSLIGPVNWTILAISLTTVYTGIHIMQGQWDILVLAAFTLGWLGVKRKNPWLLGLALVGVSTKYTNILLPTLLLLWAVREWRPKGLLYTAIIPVSMLPISILIAGWDWPLRYIRIMQVTLAYYDHYEVITSFSNTIYPSSYWRLNPPFGAILIICLAIPAIYLIIRLLRWNVNLISIFLALTLNLIITPYIALHHMVYLAPVHAKILKESSICGFILYGAGIIDLLFMWFGVGVFIYPLVVLIMLMWISASSLQRSNFASQRDLEY
ncbi:MAG: DUF2029 domain-containing protein [Anaerolineales bacterium]|nr:DUF2029 domain-containing protein [Anaerolineales bacterium]